MLSRDVEFSKKTNCYCFEKSSNLLMLRKELVRALHWCKGKETLEKNVLNASRLID